LPFLSCSVKPGFPDFVGTIYQNSGKYAKLALNYQMAIKYTKCPFYIFQMTIEYTSLFHPKALYNLPKLGFLV
jgi:hypothetical protein